MSGMKALKARSAYSRPEDPANFITYALAALLSFVGLVFLLLKAAPKGGLQIVGALAFGAALIVVFTVGALACFPKPIAFRRALVRLDRNAVCVLMLGVFAPVYLIGMCGGELADFAWGMSLFTGVLVFTVVSCVLCVMDYDGCKLVRLVLYVAIGWMCAIRLIRIVELLGLDFFWWLIGGSGIYLVGKILCESGLVPFRHTAWRLFIICGAALHFVGVYLYII